MAENLGKIDVVIKNDAQALKTPRPGQGGMPQVPGMPGQPGEGGGRGPGAILPQPRMPRGGIGKAALGLGIAGIAVGAFAFALNKAAKKLGKWGMEIEATTVRLSYLSSQAALAGVIKQLGQFNRDLKTAKILGPTILSIARLKEAVKNNIQPFKDLFASLKAKVVENFMAILVLVTDALKGLLPVLVEGLKKAADSTGIFAARAAQAARGLANAMLNVHPDVPGSSWIQSLGVMLGGVNHAIEEVSKELADIKADSREKNEYDAANEANGMLLAHLQQLTGGQWNYATQVAGQQATGSQLRPNGMPTTPNAPANTLGPKAPGEVPDWIARRKRRPGRTRFGS